MAAADARAAGCRAAGERGCRRDAPARPVLPASALTGPHNSLSINCTRATFPPTAAHLSCRHYRTSIKSLRSNARIATRPPFLLCGPFTVLTRLPTPSRPLCNERPSRPAVLPVRDRRRLQCAAAEDTTDAASVRGRQVTSLSDVIAFEVHVLEHQIDSHSLALHL